MNTNTKNFNAQNLYDLSVLVSDEADLGESLGLQKTNNIQKYNFVKKLSSTTFRDPGADSTDHLETVIGDEKQSSFYPLVKFKAWNNEANLSVKFLELFE